MILSQSQFRFLLFLFSYLLMSRLFSTLVMVDSTPNASLKHIMQKQQGRHNIGTT